LHLNTIPYHILHFRIKIPITRKKPKGNSRKYHRHTTSSPTPKRGQPMIDNTIPKQSLPIIPEIPIHNIPGKILNSTLVSTTLLKYPNTSRALEKICPLMPSKTLKASTCSALIDGSTKISVHLPSKWLKRYSKKPSKTSKSRTNIET
jgi:hypothetical protein